MVGGLAVDQKDFRLCPRSYRHRLCAGVAAVGGRFLLLRRVGRSAGLVQGGSSFYNARNRGGGESAQK